MDPFAIAIILFLTAIGLAFLDIFVPSGGLLLVMAVAAAVGAILFGFRSSTTMGMTMLTLVAASIPVGAFLAIKIWPHTPIGKRVILKLPPSVNSEKVGTELESWIGKVLHVDGDLMPAGQIKIGHRKLNAIAESAFIEAGKRVKVVAIRERCLVVRVTSEALTPLENANAKQSSQPTSMQVDEPTNLLDLPADQLGLDSINDER